MLLPLPLLLYPLLLLQACGLPSPAELAFTSVLLGLGNSAERAGDVSMPSSLLGLLNRDVDRTCWTSIWLWLLHLPESDARWCLAGQLWLLGCRSPPLGSDLLDTNVLILCSLLPGNILYLRLWRMRPRLWLSVLLLALEHLLHLIDLVS